MYPHPSSSSEPVTLEEEFQFFLRSVYPEPPLPGHPHPAVRAQYKQIRDAFYGGCLVGQDPANHFATELDAYVESVRQRVVAEAQAQGARN